MNVRLFQRGLGMLAIFGMLFGFFPTAAHAANVGTPTNLSVVGGVYTNDTTPTVTWTRPIGTTWYEVLLDDGEWIGLSNVSSYTLWSLHDGWHTLFVRAHHGNDATSTSASITFEIDTRGPTVPAVWPSNAIEDEAVTFSVTPTGEAKTLSCNLFVNGSNVGGMTAYGNTFRKIYTFKNSGSFNVHARCADGDENYTTGTSRTVTVSDEIYYDDTDTNNAPTVPAVSPSTATEDEEVTFTVDPYSDERVSWCDVYIDGDNMGDMDRQSDGTFEYEYTFRDSGTYTVYATCTDASYDVTRGTSRTVTVYNEDDDENELSVPRVTPSTATEDEEETFTVKPSSDYNVTDCWLYVEGTRVATMDEKSTNVFTTDYTFHTSGNYSVYAYCKDSHGNAMTGEKRTVDVSDDDYDSSSNNDNDDEADHGSLIKTVCGASIAVNDPCTAVYYYGEDGKRHVFPNSSVYFTWYNDFDDVIEVSGDFMSSITLGKNVTYRPGSVLVQFESAASIYAVDEDRTLRRYTTTSLITSDYGSDYKDVLVTVADSLYNNYTIGSVIDSSGDFDRNDAYYSVDSIDDVL